MKATFLKTRLLAVLFSVTINMSAHDAEIDGIYYNFSDSSATVTYNELESNCYWGAISIPENVLYEGRNYSVTKIGSGAFSGCKALTSITIPNSVSSISDYAFSGCTALMSLSIPGSVTSIGSDILAGCENLRSINFCDGVEQLIINKGEWIKKMFNDCPIKSLYLGRNIYYDGDESFVINPRLGHYGIFTSNELESLTIGNTVSHICYFAFAGCNKLKQLIIPSSVATIGTGAFAECTSLVLLDINNPTCIIGTGAFWECNSLTNVELNVKSIGEFAFSGCKSLTELRLGKDVSSIGDEAFEECNNLQNLYCYAKTPPTANKNVFLYKSGKDQWGDYRYSYYCSNVNLYVPELSISEYSNNEPWKSFKSICGIYVPVKSINIEAENITIGLNTKYKISCSINPEDASNKNIEWGSSNDLIVSVNNGILIANDVGTAYVYAVSSDNPDIKDSCCVNVIIPVTGISLSHSEFTLGIGNYFQLEKVIIPINATNKKVSWNSSNEGVCTVDNGLVKAMSKGSTIITVTTEEGNYTAHCVVNVVQQKVEINKTLLSLVVGNEERLEAVVNPNVEDNRGVLWYSSDEQIAIVDQMGNVTALKSGETWIVAESKDNPLAKDSCKVIVLQPVNGITLNYNTYQLNNIGESFLLITTFLPNDASNKEVNWKSSNESVCVVSNGMVVAVGEGTCVIIATSVDGGYIATCTVVVSNDTSIQNINSINEGSYQLFDLQGRKLNIFHKGVNLIRFNDGTLKKIYIR